MVNCGSINQSCAYVIIIRTKIYYILGVFKKKINNKFLNREIIFYTHFRICLVMVNW